MPPRSITQHAPVLDMDRMAERFSCNAAYTLARAEPHGAGCDRFHCRNNPHFRQLAQALSYAIPALARSFIAISA